MINIHNYYYMLAYAYEELQSAGYEKLEQESFDNPIDLLAAILERGIELQLKRGLGQEYILVTEPISTVRGKPNLSESIKTQSLMRNQLVCSYDTFSVNTEFNRIIKTVIPILLRSNIIRERKKKLRNQLLFFADVDEIDLHSVNWSKQYNRNNKSYQLLIYISYLIYKHMVQLKSNEGQRSSHFINERQLNRLYEKFILKYYQKEHPELKATSPRIEWQLDDSFSDLLPRMQTDITLSRDYNILILDAKFYEKTMQSRFNAQTQHSHNMYQIFTYVKNKEYELREQPHKVSGMLLYAKTDETYQPDADYRMSGNCISVRTLDLSGEFSTIREQLDAIAQLL